MVQWDFGVAWRTESCCGEEISASGKKKAERVAQPCILMAHK